MHVALLAAFVAAILTLWIPEYWPATVFELSVFTLAGIVILRWRRAIPSFPWPLWPLCFAVFVGLMQWLTHHTVYPFVTQKALLRWATFLAVFVVSFQLFVNPDRRRWFRSAMLWFAFLLAIEATVQTFTSHGKIFWLFPAKYGGNVMGSFVYHNFYSAFVEVVLPIALYEAYRRKRSSLLYTAMAAVLYASVIASASRSGAIIVTAEILVVTALLWARGETSGGFIGLFFLKMALLFGGFIAVVGWQAVWDRFLIPDPFGVRREYDIASVHMISSRPLAGWGLGTWPIIYPQYAITDDGYYANQAHSDWLEWTAEGGLPVGIAMALIFLWCLRRGFTTIWGLGPVAVFLEATVDYPFASPVLGSWAILIIGMLAAQTPEKAKPTIV